METVGYGIILKAFSFENVSASRLISECNYHMNKRRDHFVYFGTYIDLGYFTTVPNLFRCRTR